MEVVGVVGSVDVISVIFLVLVLILALVLPAAKGKLERTAMADLLRDGLGCRGGSGAGGDFFFSPFCFTR